MQCPACKETIIDGAKVCRFCGRKLSRPLGAGCLAVIGVVVIITLLPLLFGSPGKRGASTKIASGANSLAGSPKTVQEDFERVNPSFLAAVLPCQLGFTAAGRAMHSGDRYNAYDVVQRAQQACITAWENANAIKFSAATPQPNRDKLNADLDDCSHAYAQYGGVLMTIGNVLNGDDRPSTVAEARHGIGQAVGAVSTCMRTYASDLRAAGVKMPGDAQTAHAAKTRGRAANH